MDLKILKDMNDYLKELFIWSLLGNNLDVISKNIDEVDAKETINSLKEYLIKLDKPGNSIDSKKLIKGYVFLGYIISTSNSKTLMRDRELMIEVIGYFERASILYEKYFKFPQDKELMFFVYLQQSRLLDRISRSFEAKTKAELACKFASTLKDKAVALVLRADILLILGEASLAVLDYEKALTKKPDDLSIYEKLIASYKYLNVLSKNKWRNLFLKIESIVNQNLSQSEYSKNKSEEVSEEVTDYIEAIDIFSDSRFPNRNKNQIFTVRLSLNHTEPLYGLAGIYQALFDW